MIGPIADIDDIVIDFDFDVRGTIVVETLVGVAGIVVHDTEEIELTFGEFVTLEFEGEHLAVAIELGVALWSIGLSGGTFWIGNDGLVDLIADSLIGRRGGSHRFLEGDSTGFSISSDVGVSGPDVASGISDRSGWLGRGGRFGGGWLRGGRLRGGRRLGRSRGGCWGGASWGCRIASSEA